MPSALRGLRNFFKVNVFSFVLPEYLAAAALARIAFGVRCACALALRIARPLAAAAAFLVGREAEEWIDGAHKGMRNAKQKNEKAKNQGEKAT